MRSLINNTFCSSGTSTHSNHTPIRIPALPAARYSQNVKHSGFAIPIHWLSPLILAFIFTSSHTLLAQQTNKLRVTGFVEYLNNTWTPYGAVNQTLGFSDIENQSGVYNRFNFWLDPVKNIELYVGMRNNLVFGPTNNSYNDMLSTLHANYTYNDLTTYDNGWVNLTFTTAGNDSYLFYTNFDRASLKWTLHKFEMTLGRQRINWGVNLIWNPNDIFNAYNYFDFNYVERPGSDAVLMEFYTGDFSSVQLAGKIGNSLQAKTITIDTVILDKNQYYTAAAMYRFHKWNYDFQVFAGVMEDDLTAGGGWAGSIAGAGFTGEVSWFRDQQQFADTNGVWVASIAVNYTFRNRIFINLSGIYNSAGKTGPVLAGGDAALGSLGASLSGKLNAKNLTRSRFDIFGQISYPASPLINIDLASIYNPYDKSVFVGPSATFSMTDNVSLILVGQLFWGNQLTEFGDIGQMYFIDLKWSF